MNNNAGPAVLGKVLRKARKRVRRQCHISTCILGVVDNKKKGITQLDMSWEPICFCKANISWLRKECWISIATNYSKTLSCFQ